VCESIDLDLSTRHNAMKRFVKLVFVTMRRLLATTIHLYFENNLAAWDMCASHVCEGAEPAWVERAVCSQCNKNHFTQIAIRVPDAHELLVPGPKGGPPDLW